MLETTGGKIATLVMMIAVLVYTVINYMNGKAQLLVLCFMVFLCATTGLRIIGSLIDDFKHKK